MGKWRPGGPVTVDNRAVSGLRASDVVAQLRTPDIQAGVRRADVFLVTIGANDFGDHHDQVVTGTCTTTDTDCVADELEQMGWRGHFFITSDWIGRRGFLTAGQIRELRRRGHVARGTGP